MASYNQEESDKPNPNLKEEVALKPELFNGKNIDNFHNLDFISGIDLKKFNDDLCQHYDFTVLDVISKQLFPNMIYILEKILHPMKDHPLYAFDLLWTGSTREGVNISEFDFSNLKEHRVHCELELDAMLVMKNFRIGPESTSQAVLCKEPETRPGYYWIRLLAAQCRNLWLPYCSKPKSSDRQNEMYLSPKKSVDGLFNAVEYCCVEFRKVSARQNIPFSFELERKGPAITFVMKMQETRAVFVSCDIVFAVKCDFFPEKKNFLPITKRLLANQDCWPSLTVLSVIYSSGCHVVAKPSKDGDARFEWRQSLSFAEFLLMESIKQESPTAIQVYRTFKQVLKFNLKPPCGIITSYNLKTIFFYACE